MIAESHHMWSIYGSETAVSETAISQLQNKSKYRILHSILQSKFRAVFVPFRGKKNAIFCNFLYLGFRYSRNYTYFSPAAQFRRHLGRVSKLALLSVCTIFVPMGSCTFYSAK